MNEVTAALALVAILAGCSGEGAPSRELESDAVTSAQLVSDGTSQSEGPVVPFEVRRASPPKGTAVPDVAELPRATIDSREAATPSRGRRVRAATAGALHDALRSSRGGDVILLTAGATYEGNFRLRSVAGAGAGAWITIRTEGIALPPEGTRVTRGAASRFAKLVTPNADPALATERAAHHVRVMGVEIAAAPRVRQMSALVAFGSTDAEQRTVSAAPHHLVLDRVFIHGSPTLEVRRCVALNSAWTAIVDSYLAECHSNQGDSQAIWGSNGPGPFSIVNNRLEGGGENIMFGGDDSRAPEMMPSDVTIRRNYIIKPAEWQRVWSAKNLFELKVGRRVLVEGNVLEGSWLDAQIGFAILIKSVNQDGRAPWSTTQDVTIRLNRVRRSAAGVSIHGAPEQHPVAERTSRVLLEHNVIEPVGDRALGGTGRLFMLGEGARDVVIRHNTGFGTNAAVMFTNGRQPGFVFADNIVNGGEYRWSLTSADEHGTGADAVAYHAPGGRVEGNIFIQADAPPRPPNNVYLGNITELGLTDALGHDYRLRPDSRFRRAATDGTTPGANLARLDSLTAGVTGGP